MKKERFLVSERTLDEATLVAPLGDDLKVSAERDLKTFRTDDGGTFLLGDAWNCVPNGKRPSEILNELSKREGGIDEREVLEASHAWGGRFVVISRDFAFSGAFGLMPIFVSKDGFSNDPGLLAEIFGNERAETRLGFMDWIPSQASPYDGIERLVPSKILDPKTKTRRSRRIVPTKESLDRLGLSGNPKEVVPDMLATIMRNACETYGDRRILIPITGGRDSRTVLACGLKAGIGFEAFTFRNPDMPAGDLRISEEVCKKAGVARYVLDETKGRRSKKRADEYETATRGIVFGRDLEYAERGRYDDLVERFGKVALFRGGVSELAGTPYAKFFSERMGSDETISFYGLSGREAVAVRRYVAERGDEETTGLAPQELFYADQRVGSWLSAIESGFSIYDDVVSIQPFSCPAIVAKFLELPREERVGKKHLDETTTNAAPVLAGIPYAGETLRDKVGGIPNKLKWKARKILKK